MKRRLTPRRVGEFDTFLFADYSGAEDASAQRTAISLFRIERGRSAPRKIRGPFTRTSLRECLVDELDAATQADRRVLFGIDHQWSWPIDLLRVAGTDRLSWRVMLQELVRGRGNLPPLSAPSTYAAAFNRATGHSVFHSRVLGIARRYGIPSKPSWAGRAVRLTESVMPGAKPSNRLGGTGAVAGQTIAGLAELHRLFEETDARGLPLIAWPFDALADDGSTHIGCEIYPGFCKRELSRTGGLRRSPAWSDHDFDAASVCAWAARANLAGLLDLTKEGALTRRAAKREGWILGARAKPD